jgi:hypothetical protein
MTLGQAHVVYSLREAVGKQKFTQTGPKACVQTKPTNGCLLTNEATQRKKVLLKKLIVVRLVKKFPEFYATQPFFTVFTRI